MTGTATTLSPLRLPCLPQADSAMVNTSSAASGHKNNFLGLPRMFMKFGLPFRNLLYSTGLSQNESDPQPLMAPTVSPCTKYRWKNGYAKMIGPIPTTAIAIRAVSPGIVKFGLAARMAE